MIAFAKCLVTFAHAKEHLQVDHSLDDGEIDRIRGRASGAILDYIKVTETEGRLESYIDALGEPIEDSVPETVVAATLLMIGSMYDNRDGDTYRVAAPLSQPVMDLLWRQRDMALA